MLRACAALLAAAAAVLAAPQSPPEATAVYAYDVRQRSLTFPAGKSLDARLQAFAESCKAVPGGALVKLSCPEAAEDLSLDGEESAGAPTATLALFRDLDERVYIAACPSLEELRRRDVEARHSRKERREDAARKERAAREDKNCRDVAAGQTFSAEIERRTLRIVIRGTQLDFTIFERIVPEKGVGDPYEPAPSQTAAPAGPDTARTVEPIEAEQEPSFEPPPIERASGGKPSQGIVSVLPPARTSLRTGLLILECGSSRNRVFLDEAFLGSCPLRMYLIAGPHQVRVETPGREPWSREFEVEAGGTVRLQAGSERAAPPPAEQ